MSRTIKFQFPQIGVLKTGTRADIIAVEGNLDNLNAWQKLTFVIKAGQPIDRSTL